MSDTTVISGNTECEAILIDRRKLMTLA